MRALKNGKEIKHYTICPECASHLEYGYDDIQKAGGMDVGTKYIVCPVCDERIKLNTPACSTLTMPINGLASAIGSCGVK